MKKASVIRIPEKAPRAASAAPRSEKTRRGSKPVTEPLGEGLVPGRITRIEAETVTIELLSGETVQATPSSEVDPGFVAECLRARRTVLVAETPRGVELLGALQTASHVTTTGEETAIRAQHFTVDASHGIVLRVGQTEISLDPSGVVRISGDKMSVDAARVFRVLSAKAELP